MIKEVTMYTVVCDRCGKTADEGTDYSCWDEEFAARDVASEAGWIEHNENDYCPGCVEWNADESELVPIAPKSSTL